MADVTAEMVRRVLLYDRNTGEFRWRERVGNRMPMTPTGRVNSTTGYVEIGLANRLYKAHRLAWLYETGHWPKDEIDHINGCRNDNRIANLRDVPKAVNLQNRASSATNSRTGVLGVRRAKSGRFIAGISVNRVFHHLGTFDRVQDAKDAYLNAKRELHKGNTL